MTTGMIAAIQKFIGLEADEKPSSPPAGLTFQEIDTGKMFLWDGTQWQQDLSLVFAFNEGLSES